MSNFVEIKDLRKQYNPPDGVYAVGPEKGVNLDIHAGNF